MAIHPAHCRCHVADQFIHPHLRQQAIVHGDEDESAVSQDLRLDPDIGLVSTLPATAVDPDHDRPASRSLGFRPIDVEHLPHVPAVAVGNVGQFLGAVETAAGQEDDDGSTKKMSLGHG